MISNNLGLIDAHLSRFRTLQQCDLEEIRSAGLLGLTQAAHNWRPGKAAFRTFASAWVRGEMLRQRKEQKNAEETINGLDVAASEDERKLSVAKALADVCLSPRELEVVQLLFYERKTLREAGEHMSISRERVSQIKAIAMRKLRRRLETEGDENG